MKCVCYVCGKEFTCSNSCKMPYQYVACKCSSCFEKCYRNDAYYSKAEYTCEVASEEAKRYMKECFVLGKLMYDFKSRVSYYALNLLCDNKKHIVDVLVET